jgi:hypothetical protein
LRFLGSRVLGLGFRFFYRILSSVYFILEVTFDLLSSQPSSLIARPRRVNLLAFYPFLGLSRDFKEEDPRDPLHSNDRRPALCGFVAI